MGWKKGTTVMEAMPFVHVIMHKYKEERCNFCLKGCEEMKKCAACKKTWYCSVPCQKGDWKVHKMECPVMKRVPDIPTDSMRLFLRLVIRVVAGTSSTKFEKTEKPCLRSFDDLLSHKEDIQQDRKRYELFEIVRDFMQAYTHGFIQLPPEGKLLEIFGKMVTNTFTIVDESLQDVGVAIYNSPSLLDHDCVPNAVASFDGRKVVVRTIRDVDSENVYDLSLSYIDPVACRQERQTQLQQQYYFTCTCALCSDARREEIMMSVQGGSEGEVDRIKACLERIDKMKKAGESPSSMLAMCEACLQDIHIPSTNVYRVRLTGLAFDLAIEAQDWEKAFRLGVENLRPYHSIQPYYNPCVGYMYANVGKILLYLAKLSEAQMHLNKAAEILSVSLGMGHPLFHQVMELKQQCDAEIDHDRENS